MSLISNIIQEEIDRFLMEEFLFEKKKKSKKKDDEGKKKKRKHKEKKHDKHSEQTRDIFTNAKKLVGGLRTDFNAKLDRETNPNLNNQDAEDLCDFLDDEHKNLAAYAHDMYPNLTRTGAQSKLRKKVKHERSDSGSVYKLKKKEANKLRKLISKSVK
jgi:hypothetical protein